MKPVRQRLYCWRVLIDNPAYAERCWRQIAICLQRTLPRRSALAHRLCAERLAIVTRQLRNRRDWVIPVRNRRQQSPCFCEERGVLQRNENDTDRCRC